MGNSVVGAESVPGCVAALSLQSVDLESLLPPPLPLHCFVTWGKVLGLPGPHFYQVYLWEDYSKSLCLSVLLQESELKKHVGSRQTVGDGSHACQLDKLCFPVDSSDHQGDARAFSSVLVCCGSWPFGFTLGISSSLSSNAFHVCSPAVVT